MEEQNNLGSMIRVKAKAGVETIPVREEKQQKVQACSPMVDAWFAG